MYSHILESAEESGRYGDRAKEVAARTVNKFRARKKGPKLMVPLKKKTDDSDMD